MSDFKNNKYYFIHIPKSGGMSIASSLGYSHPPEDQHKNVRQVISAVGKENYENKFSFTFVRNPWDMMVSWYFFHRLSCSDRTGCEVYERISFEEWILEGCAHHWKPSLFPEIGMGQEVANDYASVWDLNYWLTDKDGKRNIKKVYKLEEIEEVWPEICENISNDGFAAQLPRKTNTSKRESDYRKYYSDECKSFVAKLFAQQIDEFNYEY